MTLVSSAASLALIGAAIAYLLYPMTILLLVAMALLFVILVTMAATRVEVIAPLTDAGNQRVDRPRDRRS